jgi:hypothetical protein
MGKAGVKWAAGLALVLGLAACSGPQYPTTAAVHAAPPALSPPALEPAPRSPAQRPQISLRDQCGAAGLQGLIGRPRTEVPIPLDPNRQRVACTRCPGAEDSDPSRLNFFFDAETGVIKQIRCG